MENNTKEPTLEEYGLTASLYDNFRNEKRDLEKSLLEYKKTFRNKIEDLESKDENVLFTISCVLGFLISYFILEGSFWASIFASIPFGILIAIMLPASLFKSKEIKEYEQRIESTELKTQSRISDIESTVSAFEKASVAFYKNYLDQFFTDNLFKKRSGSEKFEKALSEFADMINEVKEINEKLIFLHEYTYSHELYLAGRKVNHDLQKEKKQLFHAFDSVRTMADNAHQDSSKTNNKSYKLKPKERDNLSQINDASTIKIHEPINEEIVIFEEKELVPIIPPEKKYRTARKIDNWEEINRKRKITGTKGEEIALAIEQEYFESVGRKDLADRVRHVSVEDGDGLGYDILSFFDNGKEKYIEVKSTTVSIGSPFNISANELGFLREHMDDSFVCRVLVSDEVLDEVPQYEMVPSYIVLDHDISPTAFMVKPKKNHSHSHSAPQRSVWERIFVD